eukprot:GHVP01054042.1.p1 GENE.GHVP01054042.1~~GHVP01054042.1.p1  ORF type:complete len:180 (+),score=34.21 GHVP01054042.1:40-579(+)
MLFLPFIFWALAFFNLRCLAEEGQAEGGLEILQEKPNLEEIQGLNEVRPASYNNAVANPGPGPGLGLEVEPQNDMVKNEQPNGSKLQFYSSFFGDFFLFYEIVSQNNIENEMVPVKHEPEENVSSNGFIVIFLLIVVIGAVCFCHSRFRRSRSRPAAHKGIRNVIGRQDGNYIEMNSEV